jgi:hypothetical protein
MSDLRRCSCADMREKNYKNLFAAGRSVKNVPSAANSIFSPVDFSKISKFTSLG